MEKHIHRVLTRWISDGLIPGAPSRVTNFGKWEAWAIGWEGQQIGEIYTNTMDKCRKRNVKKPIRLAPFSVTSLLPVQRQAITELVRVRWAYRSQSRTYPGTYKKNSRSWEISSDELSSGIIKPFVFGPVGRMLSVIDAYYERRLRRDQMIFKTDEQLLEEEESDMFLDRGSTSEEDYFSDIDENDPRSSERGKKPRPKSARVKRSSNVAQSINTSCDEVPKEVPKIQEIATPSSSTPGAPRAESNHFRIEGLQRIRKPNWCKFTPNTQDLPTIGENSLLCPQNFATELSTNRTHFDSTTNLTDQTTPTVITFCRYGLPSSESPLNDKPALSRTRRRTRQRHPTPEINLTDSEFPLSLGGFVSGETTARANSTLQYKPMFESRDAESKIQRKNPSPTSSQEGLSDLGLLENQHAYLEAKLAALLVSSCETLHPRSSESEDEFHVETEIPEKIAYQSPSVNKKANEPVRTFHFSDPTPQPGVVDLEPHDNDKYRMTSSKPSTPSKRTPTMVFVKPHPSSQSTGNDVAKNDGIKLEAELETATKKRSKIPVFCANFLMAKKKKLTAFHGWRSSPSPEKRAPRVINVRALKDEQNTDLLQDNGDAAGRAGVGASKESLQSLRESNKSESLDIQEAATIYIPAIATAVDATTPGAPNTAAAPQPPLASSTTINVKRFVPTPYALHVPINNYLCPTSANSTAVVVSGTKSSMFETDSEVGDSDDPASSRTVSRKESELLESDEPDVVGFKVEAFKPVTHAELNTLTRKRSIPIGEIQKTATDLAIPLNASSRQSGDIENTETDRAIPLDVNTGRSDEVQKSETDLAIPLGGSKHHSTYENTITYESCIESPCIEKDVVCIDLEYPESSMVSEAPVLISESVDMQIHGISSNLRSQLRKPPRVMESQNYLQTTNGSQSSAPLRPVEVTSPASAVMEQTRVPSANKGNYNSPNHSPKFAFSWRRDRSQMESTPSTPAVRLERPTCSENVLATHLQAGTSLHSHCAEPDNRERQVVSETGGPGKRRFNRFTVWVMKSFDRIFHRKSSKVFAAQPAQD